MKDHYTLSTVSKKDLVNAFEISEDDARLVHKYRKSLPAIIDAEGDEGFCVDMRELHKQLKVKTRFNDWAKRSIKDFVDGDDFYSFLSKSNGGRKGVEYMLTVYCAKHIAMMEKTEIGRTIRDYFMLCEKLVVRMARRNPIRQSCKDSTKMMANNIAHRVPPSKLPSMMQDMNAFICTVATGARPATWRKMIGVDNVRDFLKENAKVSELKRYDEVAQMAEFLSRDGMQTRETIKEQLKRVFGESEIYYSYLYNSGVKEF